MKDTKNKNINDNNKGKDSDSESGFDICNESEIEQVVSDSKQQKEFKKFTKKISRAS